MPELPEVETIIRTLERSLLGCRVLDVDLKVKSLLENHSEFPLSTLEGETFVGFHRRGKYLWFEFTGGFHWIVHLRMEGKFYLYSKPTTPTKHIHCIIQTDKGWIHYLDTRKFSRMAVTKKPLEYLEGKKLGFVPFDPYLDANKIYADFHKSSRVIKLLLLDQSIITGIGNIYADEILFETHIHPMTKGVRITKKETQAIIDATRLILARAIDAGGTTIRSYTSSLDVHGRFQVSLNAYGQAGKPCNRCGTVLERIVIGGRSTVFCPKCQKVKR